ncbi:MAG: serine/threonine protein kinase [Deltaproteobacteria bacterium]|nr:serine/threonine protein kinase [Deltaproteobacteria bacterium]
MRDTVTDLPKPIRYLCPRCRTTFPTAAPCIKDGIEVLPDRTGEVLAHRYRFRRPLGRGAMGVIWEAEQLTLHRKVAVKLMRANDEEAETRFRRGAIVMAKMSHPNIVALHDYGETMGPEGFEHFLVMDRLEGAPLARFFTRGFTPEQARSACLQTLAALEHVHRKGYIHRDVKPANLFVTAVDDDPFVLKLLDFGIARLADSATTPEGVINIERERAMRVTQPLRILGTPEYMAPEQVLGQALDLRVDLYAVGIMLFHLMTGRLPFRGVDRHELYAAHLRDPMPALAETLVPREDHGTTYDRDALAPWQHFLQRALAKNPLERFPSALEMRRALAALPALT